MTDGIWVLVFFVGIAIYLYVRHRFRETKRVFVTDYQRGIKYKKGVFDEVLSAGSYRAFTPTVQISIVDMRAQPFVIERVFVRDVLSADSVISIGGELQVRDPYLSVTALKDEVGDSVSLIREALRETMPRVVIDRGVESRKRIAEAIATAANNRLAESGMEVRNLLITEIWSSPVQSQRRSEAN